MTKSELVKFIMENTNEYKKTHLMEKYKVELEEIAAMFQSSENIENGTEIPQPEGEDWNDVSAEKNAPANPFEALNASTVHFPNDLISAAYESNAKIVKGGRKVDKNEFREVVMQTASLQIIREATTDPTAIAELTASVMRQLIAEPAAFLPLNDNERKMLESIPMVAGYENPASVFGGKEFLQTVKELHNIEVASSRALMVSMKRKKLIVLGGGKNGGGTPITVTLGERGKRILGIAS